MKRKICKKQDLIDLGIKVEGTDKKYKIYRNGKELKRYKLKTYRNHKKTTAYYGYSIYYGKIKTEKGFRYRQDNILEHVILWLWFKSDIPDGYDVYHIDKNKLNNKLSNLELLTRKENLKKRGVGRNRYTYNMTDRQILKLRKKNSLKKRSKIKWINQLKLHMKCR